MKNLNRYTKLWFVVPVLLITSGVAFAQENYVYLMLKAKLKDTTYSQVVFLYEKDVQTIEKCKAEVKRGKQGRWRYYQHLLNTRSGVSFDTVYHCISTPKLFEYWNPGARYNDIYFVDARQEKVQIELKDSYSNCLTDLRSGGNVETDLFFCAKTSQKEE